jgi:hypothetical protein
MEHANFWDRVDVFRLDASERSLEPVAVIGELRELAWFVEAKPIARRVAEASIYWELKKEAEYVRFVEQELANCLS